MLHLLPFLLRRHTLSERCVFVQVDSVVCAASQVWTKCGHIDAASLKVCRKTFWKGKWVRSDHISHLSFAPGSDVRSTGTKSSCKESESALLVIVTQHITGHKQMRLLLLLTFTYTIYYVKKQHCFPKQGAWATWDTHSYCWWA